MFLIIIAMEKEKEKEKEKEEDIDKFQLYRMNSKIRLWLAVSS